MKRRCRRHTTWMQKFSDEWLFGFVSRAPMGAFSAEWRVWPLFVKVPSPSRTSSKFQRHLRGTRQADY
jgi:hypothetical protein